jgi:ubiquinone/menaquinone biosynthesis C-methylase UbiE
MKNYWEDNVYSLRNQINAWPFDCVVSAVKKYGPMGAGRKPRALEVGCGTGNNLWYLAEEGYDVFGLDISSTAVLLAQEHLKKRGFYCEVQVSDLSIILYKDNYFDLTIDRGCLSCLQSSSLPGTIRELHRVLRPGGIHLSFSLYGEAHPDRLLGEELEPWTFGRFRGGKLANSGIITFFNAERIHSLFERYTSREVRRICRYDGDHLEHDEYSLIALK